MADSPVDIVAPVIVDSPIPSAPAPSTDAPALSVTPDPAAPESTPSKIDPAYKELNQYFGIDSSGLADDASASAALRPVIGLLAQSGVPQNAPIQPQGVDPGTIPVAPEQPLSPTATVPDFSFDEVDFGEAGPEVKKAFQAQAAQNQKALQQVMGEAQAAKKSADEAKQAFVNSNAQSVHAQEQQVLSRANSWLDTLQSPKYGVGQNRTMIQQMASQQVMQVAGNIIRGTQNHGQTPPAIETIMRAAVVYIEGKLPTPATPPTTPVPGLPHQTASGVAPAPVNGSGSAGSGGELMSDKEFLDGARSILSR